MQKNITEKYQSANVILKQIDNYGPLVLGDCNSPIDKNLLKINKIKTIITIGKQCKIPQNKISTDVILKNYQVHDNKFQKIGQLLDQIYQVIQQGRNKGGVLIHCYAGVSRSSSFVIGYIMKKNKLNYDEAKNLVKKNRPCIDPNQGFVNQLKTYWKVLKERQQAIIQKIQLSTEFIKKIQELQLQKRVPQQVKSKNYSPQKKEQQQHKKKQKSVSFNISEKIEYQISKQSTMSDNLNDLLKPTKTSNFDKQNSVTTKKQIVGIYSTKTKVK